MEKLILTVPKISCGHCVMAIKNELGEMEGMGAVDGNPDDKTITVEYDTPATIEKIKDALTDMNYPAE